MTLSIVLGVYDATATSNWQLACVAITVASKLPLVHIIPDFKRSLAELPTMVPPLEEGQDTVGIFGLLMFVWGVVDFIRGPLLCASLALCGQWWLFACCVSTLMVVTCVTMHLAYCVLAAVAASSEEGAGWMQRNGKAVALVVLVASSRLDMLCIFRLRICGYKMVDCPMEDKHFYFVRNAGMFHHLIEDLPHGLVSVARLAIHKPCTGTGTGWMDAFLMEHDNVLTVLSLTVSLVSILFGLINKTIQLLVLRAGASGAADRQGSILLSNINSLRLSLGGSTGMTRTKDLDARLLASNNEGGESLGGSE